MSPQCALVVVQVTMIANDVIVLTPALSFKVGDLSVLENPPAHPPVKKMKTVWAVIVVFIVIVVVSVNLFPHFAGTIVLRMKCVISVQMVNYRIVLIVVVLSVNAVSVLESVQLRVLRTPTVRDVLGGKHVLRMEVEKDVGTEHRLLQSALFYVQKMLIAQSVQINHTV